MERRYHTTILNSVHEFLMELPKVERAKILSDIETMKKGDWSSLHVKTLKSPLRELIIKQYRIIFFISGNVLYFVRAFQKKTAKTPREEIEQAEQIYKLFIQ